MRAGALLLLVILGGCRFGVEALEIDEGVPGDGGSDDARDANVELGEPPVDANLFDFAGAPDLHRAVPDGAMPRKIGYPCATGNECDNGLCIDGYCCDTLCDPFDPANQCRACNVPGSEGHCTFAQDNTDPRGLCQAEAASTCGRDGVCDGKGNCRLWGKGTLCGPASCKNNQLEEPPICDGAGHCLPGAKSADCTPYTCVNNACTTECTPPANGCVAPATCSFGQCGKAALGDNCALGSDCVSGFCAQGVCCVSDCSGVCLSCALPNAKGLCLPIPAGTDPLLQCDAEPRASCGRDGFCDGNGACRLWSNTTVCVPRTCQGDSTVAPRFCDGNGTCLAGVASACNPYTCEAATGVCYGPPCSSDANCTATAKCNGNGKCIPR